MYARTFYFNGVEGKLKMSEGTGERSNQKIWESYWCVCSLQHAVRSWLNDNNSSIYINKSSKVPEIITPSVEFLVFFYFDFGLHSNRICTMQYLHSLLHYVSDSVYMQQIFLWRMQTAVVWFFDFLGILSGCIWYIFVYGFIINSIESHNKQALIQ